MHAWRTGRVVGGLYMMFGAWVEPHEWLTVTAEHCETAEID